MKYVLYRQKNLMLPVVFPDVVTHSQVVVEGAELVGAGFYHPMLGCYGCSESLKNKLAKQGKDLKVCESRPEHTVWVRLALTGCDSTMAFVNDEEFIQ